MEVAAEVDICAAPAVNCVSLCKPKICSASYWLRLTASELSLHAVGQPNNTNPNKT